MLGENILRLKKEANLSQEALGDIIGVTRQTISNWELEETAPNPEQLKLLSKAFDKNTGEKEYRMVWNRLGSNLQNEGNLL